MIRVLRLVLALVVLMAITRLVQTWSNQSVDFVPASAVDALGRPFSPLPTNLTGATLSIGLLLMGSWLVGRVFKSIHLPKLSGYLVFGMLVGPQALAIITKEQIPFLKLVESLAIALIALMAGGEIEVAFLRRSAKLISAVTALQLAMVFVAVTGVVYALGPSVGLSDPDDTQTRLITAVIAGTIALAASPSVFIAVMNELRATGESVQAALSVMISKDIALIVLFTVVIAIASATVGQPGAVDRGDEAPSNLVDSNAASVAELEHSDSEAATSDDATEGVTMGSVAGRLSAHLLGSLLVGAVFGLAFAWYMHRIRAHLAIFVICGCMTIALVSAAFHLEALIVALVAGILMRNLWHERVGPVFQTMEDLSLPVYCVFFAVAGAKLDLHALATLWPAAFALVGARAAAIWVSTDLGCRLVGQEPPIRTWLWTAFIPQAGVSVALIAIVETSFRGHPFATPLYSLVLASIGIHELIGPLVLKIGLQKLSTSGSDATA